MRFQAMKNENIQGFKNFHPAVERFVTDTEEYADFVTFILHLL